MRIQRYVNQGFDIGIRYRVSRAFSGSVIGYRVSDTMTLGIGYRYWYRGGRENSGIGYPIPQDYPIPNPWCKLNTFQLKMDLLSENINLKIKLHTFCMNLSAQLEKKMGKSFCFLSPTTFLLLTLVSFLFFWSVTNLLLLTHFCFWLAHDMDYMTSNGNSSLIKAFKFW